MFRLSHTVLGAQNYRNLLANFGAFVLLVIFLHSCGTNRVQKMADEGNGFEESELLELSQDCKFVRKRTTKGLVKVKDRKYIRSARTNFLQNDFLVALLSRTDCFNGYSSEQLISIFGDAKKRPFHEGSSRFLLKYNFIITEKKSDEMIIVFQDDKLESFRIRRTEININY